MPSLPLKQGELNHAQNSDRESSGRNAFIQVPVELLTREDLSPAALKLYLLLLAYCGPKDYAWPGQARLASQMQLSERRVRSLLRELDETGLVVIRQEKGATNTYILKKAGINQKTYTPETERQRHQLPEKSFPTPRKFISAHVHESELNHVCSEVQSLKVTRGGLTPDKTGSGHASSSPSSPDEAACYTPEEQEIQDLLLGTGMPRGLAEELVGVITGNGRDISYVKRVIEASHEEHIHNPLGFIRFMLLRNADPVAREAWGSKASRRKTRTRSTPPIDFTKYTSGKYSYLASSPTQDTEDPSLKPSPIEDLNHSDPGEQSAPVTNSTSNLNLPELPVLQNQPQKSGAITLQDSILATIWLRVRASLARSGLVPERALEHGRLKKGVGEEEYFVQFPAWLTLGTDQEELIRNQLARFLKVQGVRFSRV